MNLAVGQITYNLFNRLAVPLLYVINFVQRNLLPSIWPRCATKRGNSAGFLCVREFGGQTDVCGRMKQGEGLLGLQ